MCTVEHTGKYTHTNTYIKKNLRKLKNKKIIEVTNTPDDIAGNKINI